MIRRFPGILLMAVGAMFIAWTFVANLIAVGPAFDALTDDFRPFMSDDAIATAEQDIARLRSVSEELSTTAIPTLAAATQTTPEQFSQRIAADYPDVASGIAALPTIVTTFSGVVDTLGTQQSNFQQADAIPTSSIPAATVPWSLLAVGVLVMGLGAWFLARPMQLDASIAVVVGLVLIAVPLLLSIPGKSAAADDLNRALEPVYTAEMVAEGQQALAIIGAMGTQMQTEMLPALAVQLQMPEEQFSAFLGENLPATAAALTALPESTGRFEAMVTAFDANLANYTDILSPVAFTPIAWMMAIGGLAVAICGLLPLLSERFRGGAIHWHGPHPTPAR